MRLVAVRSVVLALTLMLAAGAANAIETSTIVVNPFGSGIELPATLIKPDGVGPLPAVVIMHDCSGLGPRSSGSPKRWADELVPQGYVVLIPDSFTPRGLPNGVCLASVTPREREKINDPVRATDAYGALAALRALPYVDGKHVGIMGGSHGGAATLMTMVSPTGGLLTEAKANGFAAGIALYPRCDSPYGTWSVIRSGVSRGPVSGYFGVYIPLAPLLILDGELDDWTPAEPCRRMVEAARAQGYPLDIKTYPGAHHAFDSAFPVRYVAERNNINSPTGKGATTGGNAEAWADAKLQVARFFGETLKGKK